MRWKQHSKTKEPENKEHAYEYAVFLLSLKLRTMGEVLDKMKKRGYADSVIEETIEQLKKQRYLDDQRYAEIFLENLKSYRQIGYFGIKKKFMEKKLPSELIERVLEAGYTKDDELEVARRFLKKEHYIYKEKSVESGIEYTTYGEDGAQKEKQKMANRMKSRGFRSDVISQLLF